MWWITDIIIEPNSKQPIRMMRPCANAKNTKHPIFLEAGYQIPTCLVITRCVSLEAYVIASFYSAQIPKITNLFQKCNVIHRKQTVGYLSARIDINQRFTSVTIQFTWQIYLFWIHIVLRKCTIKTFMFKLHACQHFILESIILCVRTILLYFSPYGMHICWYNR